MKIMKKLTAMALSVLMALAMCATAFAADSVTLTISDPVAGHTYKVYQLLTGDVSGLEDGEGTLSNVKAGTALKDGVNAQAVADELAEKSNGALSDAAYGYVDTTKGATATLNTETTSAQVAPGYYVIVDEYSEDLTGKDVVYSRNMVAVVGDTTVKPKTETPSIDKNIIDTDANKALDYDESKKGGKTDTAAIGDEIEFEVTGSVPNYEGYEHYYYILNDTLSDGLTLDENSFQVKVGDKTLTKGTDYYVYLSEDKQSFELAFADIKNYTVGDAISVKYKATINEKAKIGIEANTNTVKLIYSNNPFLVTLPFSSFTSSVGSVVV